MKGDCDTMTPLSQPVRSGSCGSEQPLLARLAYATLPGCCPGQVTPASGLWNHLAPRRKAVWFSGLDRRRLFSGNLSRGQCALLLPIPCHSTARMRLPPSRSGLCSLTCSSHPSGVTGAGRGMKEDSVVLQHPKGWEPRSAAQPLLLAPDF